MRRWWQNWVRWCARRESATTLSLFRVLVGLVTLYSLMSALVSGADALWLGKAHGGMGARESGHWLWALLDGATGANIDLLFWVAAAGAVLVSVGLGGRWPLLLTQQAYYALISVNRDTSGGYDALLNLALLTLFFSECTQTLSLDCRLRHGTWFRHAQVLAWPRYLLVLQLLVMYTATGFQKVGLAWTPLGGYTALYYILHDPTWIRHAPSWVPTLDPLLRVATAISWHWEQLSILMLPVLYARWTASRQGRLRRWLLRYDLRIPWALTGLGVHVGILLLLNVGFFSWISLAYYVNLWSGAELDAAWARFSSRGRRGTTVGPVGCTEAERSRTPHERTSRTGSLR